MPDTTTPQQTPAADAPAKKPAPPAKGKKPRNWRRRAIVSLLLFIAFVVVARVAIVLIAPRVVARVAGWYGLKATHERLEVHFLAGDVAIWHLNATPAQGGGDSVIHIDYARAHINPWEIFVGRVHAYRVEADGVSVTVERDKQGKVALLDQLLAQQTHQQQQAARHGIRPEDVDLTAPLQIDALRVQYVKARVKDQFVTPPLDATLELNVRVSDVDSDTRPVRYQVDAAFPPLLDAMRVEGTAKAKGKNLEADMVCSIRGLRPRPAAGYLRPLGIEPRADRIDVTLSGTVSTHGVMIGGPTTAPSGGGGDGSKGREALVGKLTMKDLKIRSDNVEAAGVDALTIDVAAITEGLIDLGLLAIDGARVNASRTLAGNIAIAGLELVPPPAAAAATAPTSRPTVAAKDLAQAASSVSSESSAREDAASALTSAGKAVAAMTQPFSPPPFRARLAEFRVTNTKLAFGDAAVTPPADLALVVEQLVVKDIDGDPANPDKQLSIDGTFAAPGIADRIALTGTAKPFATTSKGGEFSVKVEGIKPLAVHPYLAAAGVESQFAGGTLAADLSAELKPAPGGAVWQADAKLRNVVLTDGANLLALEAVTVAGARLMPDGTIRVDVVEGKGPTLSAKRDKEGRIVAVGIRTGVTVPPPAHANGNGEAMTAAARIGPATQPVAAQASQATQPVIVATVEGEAAATLPKIEIGKLTWGGVKVSLSDETLSPTAKFELEDVSLEVSNFRTAPDATGDAQPGKVTFSLRAPQLAKKLSVTGPIVADRDRISFDLTVEGEGIRSADIAPYLAGTGVEPTLKDAALKLAAKLDLKTANNQLTASLAVKDFKYTDEGQELVGVDALRVDGVELTKSGVAVASVEMQKPRAVAARDADGALRVAGLRFPPPAPAATQPSAEQKPTSPAAPPATQPATVVVSAPAFVASLKKLVISGGSVAWSDKAVSPAVEQVAGADVELTGFTIGDPKAAPAQLKVKASAKPSLDEATVNGTVSLLPTSQGATLEIAARGLRQGALAPYLPPGLRVTLKDGRFRTKIDAAIGDAPKGGRQAKLAVTALDYRDAGAAEPLLALDALSVKVDRLDLPGHVIALDEIVLSGVDTGAEQDASGTLRALGVLVEAPVEAAKKGQAPATAPATKPVAAVAKATVPAATQPSTQPAAVDVATLIAAAHQPMPLFTLNKLDVGVKRVFFKSGATPGSTPIVLKDLRVRSKKRIELLGDENAPRPPAEIEAVLGVEPLAKEIRVNTRLASAGAQTDVHVDVAASGVRGQGVTDLLPALKPSLDGAGLTNGQFKATVDASLKMQARALVAMDFTKGVELDMAVNGVAFKPSPDGKTLAGVEEVRSEGVKFDPKTGNLHAKSIDITKPIAHAYNDKDGLHVLGLVLKKAPAATQPATAPTTPPAPQPVVAHATTPAEPAPEIKIDRLTISGLDASYEDRTTQPVTLVPLNALDVEVRGFTTQALTQEIPVTFSATVSAGKVPLPPRQVTGLAAGVMSGIGSIGKSKEQSAADTAPEQRELFAQATADGRLALYPQPKGWAKTSLSGFEVTGVRGIAAQMGVTLGNGTVDNTVDARLPGDGSLTAKTRTILTDLRMKETADGPVQKGLKLPVPPDVAIGMIEDPSGGITMAVPVELKQGELNMDALKANAVGAAAGVLATGLASAPLKTVQGAGDVVGGVAAVTGISKFLPWSKKPQAPPGPVEMVFLPGDASVGFGASAQVREIAERLRKESSLVVTLKHRMSAADVAAAQQRANPSADDAAALAYQLRARKLQLASDRAAVAALARAELASSLPGTTVSQTVERLRALDRESAETEAALDEVFDLLRPGADRAAPRRTRGAAIAIGNARLEAVKASLLLAGVTDPASRVRITAAKFEPDAELAAPTDGGGVVMTTGKAAK